MLSRRLMLQGLGGIGALTALYGHPCTSIAGTITDRRLVLVLLRGGLDGLNTVVPYADPAYRPARGSLSLDPPNDPRGVVDLDGSFGLHPALAPLAPYFAAGEFAAVHAVGLPYPGRSHFDSQDVLENGSDRPIGARDGWLNRAVAALNGTERMDRRLGLSVGLSGGPSVPLILRGPAGIASWTRETLPNPEPTFMDKLQVLYGADPVLGPMLAQGMETTSMMTDLLSKADRTMTQRRRRKSNEVETMVAAVGSLLASPRGPRVAVFDTGGYDTHANQGTTSGTLARRLESLAGGLMVLAENMQSVWDRTVIVTATEFGRTVVANGTGGTDHGTASVSLLLGGAVNGGRVFGTWPGLDPHHLFEGRDLATTTDIRGLFKALLRDHLGLNEQTLEAKIFPGSRGAPYLEGLIRA